MTLHATIELEMRPGLSLEEAERRLALGARAGDVGARVVAFYLVDLAERGAYLEQGYSSIVGFAEARLRRPASTIRELLATGRALAELPVIDSALCAEAISWSQTRLLARIATPETESAWIDWAQGRTVRQLEAQARVRERGDTPTDPERRTIHEIRVKVQGVFDPGQKELWDLAREKLQSERGGPVGDTEMMLEAAQVLLRTRSDGTVPGRVPIPRRETPVPPVPPERRDRPTQPALRDAVLARDGNRCRCCRSKKNLAVHHLEFREHGGRTAAENLATVCEDCHSLVHGGLLRTKGGVDDLKFTDRRGRDLDTPAAPAGLGLTRHGDARASRENRSDDPAKRDARASRPASLAEAIGQRRVVRNLRRAVDAARRLDEPLPHVLLCGPPGLGKTSIARAVAADLGAAVRALSAPLVKDAQTLFAALRALDPGDVLFMDEIHRLPAAVAETLYEAMEAGRITLIGATTEEDLLPEAFLSRFEIRHRMAYYTDAELVTVIRRAARRVGLLIEDRAAGKLASVARQTPRIVLALFRSVHQEAVLDGAETIHETHVRAALDQLGIDDCGLRLEEREYLDLLGPRPQSLSTIAARLGRAPRTVRTVIEPWLLRRGLVRITPLGRVRG